MQDLSDPPHDPFILLLKKMVPMAIKKKDSKSINKVNNNCIINFKLNKGDYQ